MAVPCGTESARPLLPAKDFDLSKKFYETLGFEKLLGDTGVAIFGIGASSFILQRFYQKDWIIKKLDYQEDWAENFMMQLMVDDLDAWWAHIQSLDLPKAFGVPPPSAPALQ
jgi:hypothetical protein